MSALTADRRRGTVCAANDAKGLLFHLQLDNGLVLSVLFSGGREMRRGLKRSYSPDIYVRS